MLIGIAFKKKAHDYGWWDKIKSKAVQIWTGSEYFHSEFIIGDYWVSANTSGIEIHALRPLSWMYDYFFIEVDISEDHCDKIIRFIEQQSGAKYDWAGIWMSQFLNIGVNRSDKWFCSELCTKLMQLCLVEETFMLQSHKIDPGELFRLLEGMVDQKRVDFLIGETAQERLERGVFEKC